MGQSISGLLGMGEREPVEILMNSFDDADASREEVRYLRAQNARLRREVDELRARPAGPEEPAGVTALRWVVTALWIIGALCTVILAVALVAYFSIAAGGLKG